MSDLWQFAVVGLASGGAYALVALGVVAVYKGSGILNFAQGAIGMISAYVFWQNYEGGDELPLPVALLLGVITGVLLGLGFYAIVVRQLRNASDIAKVVATLGFMLLLQSFAVWHFGAQQVLVRQLFGAGRYELWGASISRDTVVVLACVVVAAAVLSAIFRWTKLGLRATALREAPQAAAAIGISPHPTALLTWGLGGGLAAIGGIVLLPLTGLSPTNLTLLVVPALAAGLLGSFNRIWVTVVAGLAIGVVEAILKQHRIEPGLIKSVPFAVIIVAIVIGGAALPGRGESQAARLPRLGSGKPRWIATAVVFVAVALIPLTQSATWSETVITSALFAMLALSIVVVTGYAGQINLAPAALAGFSSLITARVINDWGWPFLPAVVAGVVAAIALGLVIGAPAVRVRGVNLAIVTLGLALAVEQSVLLPPRFTGGIQGLQITPPEIFGFSLDPGLHPDRYAIALLVALTLAALAVLNVRRGRSGRRYAAVRANERGAAALGISVQGAKLSAFAVSAAIAGLVGGLTTFRYRTATFSDYDVFKSILTVAFTIVGGVGFVVGALFAGFATTGGVMAHFFNDVLGLSAIDRVLPMIMGFFVIDVMVRFPDGFVLQFIGLKNWIVVKARARGAGATSPAEPDESPGEAPAPWPRTAGLDPHRPVLEAAELSVTYGVVRAVDAVDLAVRPGQVLGVIGPNGAGKTSLIDALTGYARNVTGDVRLRQTSIARLAPHGRARRGLGRTFQNLELFEDLTVRENVLAGLDRRDLAAYATDLVWPGKAALTPAARAALTRLGLTPFLDTVVADLPQGLRRMVAIARLVAQEPVAICLDEPAAGLNGAERRVAAQVFRALADEMGAAVLIVEHNIDVVAGICDELIVLDFGRVIARGPAAEVLASTVVRDAYLGIADGESELEAGAGGQAPEAATAST